MIKVGITGQSGFIGTHLYNSLKLYRGKYSLIPFSDEYFNESMKLEDFVAKCDVIIHLAAMNRHNDPEIIYQTNLELVKKLINALETTGSRPYVIFSSSIQEESDNVYGKSKKEGRKIFENWAKKNNTRFTGLIIPNVFGPFGQPFYNSVIATFCYQLTHNEIPKIEVDGNLKLIYVGELIQIIISKLEGSAANRNQILNEYYLVPHTIKIKVSEILGKLQLFKYYYYEKGIIPDIHNSFERNLFNTFLCYLELKNFFPFKLKKNSDDRGSFVEVLKLNGGGQISFSTTAPGITRGNHYHTRKAERFMVIKGKARIEIRKIGTDEVLSFELNGENPSFVDMPVWYTHNITNIGEEELYTLFWINEFFNIEDTDTFIEKV